ncbi:MAG: FtsX-like permease family protein [Pseudomonadales bacterium]|nr:FtsX-like permease family protein [Pseudomonadales bacterium]
MFRSSFLTTLAMLFNLSLRNIVRYRRRNFFLFAAIAVAVGGTTLSNALIRGWQVDMLETAVSGLTGHIKLQAPGFADDPSLQNAFSSLTPISLDDDVPILGFAQRINIPAVISSERETRGVALVGVDPANEGISLYRDFVIEGEDLGGPEDGRLLIGKALAETLQTRVGRRVVVIMEGADGKSRERGYRIAGVFDAPMKISEELLVFTGLEAMQAALGNTQLRTPITELSLVLQAEEDRGVAQRELAAQHPQLVVKDWREMQPQVAEIVDLVGATMAILFFLIMSALTFGLVNTLIATVMQRTRELGMLRALGMNQRLLLIQVVMECVGIMVVGVIAGLLLGIAMVFGLGDGIDLSAFSESVEAFGMSTVLKPVLTLEDLLMFGGLSVLVGVFASYFPARRALKISPLMAMNR